MSKEQTPEDKLREADELYSATCASVYPPDIENHLIIFAKSQAAKEYRQSQQKEVIDVEDILRKIKDEIYEWQEGKYKDIYELLEKVVKPHLQPAQSDVIPFAKFCMENAKVWPAKGGKYSINENPLQAGWSYEDLLEEFQKP